MLPPTESPATAMRLASRPLPAPSALDPARDGVVLLDRDRIARLRGTAVLGEHDRRFSADSKLADEPVMRERVAEHPAGTVQVDDHRQRSGRPARLDDPDAHLTRRAALDVHPLLVDRRLRDLAGLHLVDCLAAVGDRELVATVMATLLGVVAAFRASVVAQ